MQKKTKLDAARGLYQKYHVERLNDLSGKHKDCEFFVLDWNHDKFVIPAMSAYADACEEKYPLLAQDIRVKIKKYSSPAKRKISYLRWFGVYLWIQLAVLYLCSGDWLLAVTVFILAAIESWLIYQSQINKCG